MRVLSRIRQVLHPIPSNSNHLVFLTSSNILLTAVRPSIRVPDSSSLHLLNRRSAQCPPGNNLLIINMHNTLPPALLVLVLMAPVHRLSLVRIVIRLPQLSVRIPLILRIFPNDHQACRTCPVSLSDLRSCPRLSQDFRCSNFIKVLAYQISRRYIQGMVEVRLYRVVRVRGNLPLQLVMGHGSSHRCMSFHLPLSLPQHLLPRLQLLQNARKLETGLQTPLRLMASRLLRRKNLRRLLKEARRPDWSTVIMRSVLKREGRCYLGTPRLVLPLLKKV